jgi:hypothetical protein
MNPACLANSAFPQRYSRDFYVRVGRQLLCSIPFEHLSTDETDEVLEDTRLAGGSSRRAGTTEWQARLGGMAVSLAWDWVELCDGAVRALKQVAPRGNLKLIDAQGYDLRADDALDLIWERIDGIGWQRHAFAPSTYLPG